MTRRMTGRLTWAVFMAVLSIDAASAIEGTRTMFPAPGTESAMLSIHGAADLSAMTPLVLDFQEMAPDISIEYFDYVTNDLQKKASDACETGRILGDILLSSSIDQMVKLANDGCASAHNSYQTTKVPPWANWRDEVFGFTYEPSVMVYNARYVPAESIPRTHEQFADLLRTRLDYYRGRIGTYDIRVSGGRLSPGVQ